MTNEHIGMIAAGYVLVALFNVYMSALYIDACRSRRSTRSNVAFVTAWTAFWPFTLLYSLGLFIRYFYHGVRDILAEDAR